MIYDEFTDNEISHYMRDKQSNDLITTPLDVNSRFDRMWPTVYQICESLLYDQAAWEQQMYTITHIPSGISYWLGSNPNSDDPITDIFRPRDETVFNKEQGAAIRTALRNSKIVNVDPNQLLIMAAFNTLPKATKPEPGIWGKLYASIAFFPTFAFYCLKRKRVW